MQLISRLERERQTDFALCKILISIDSTTISFGRLGLKVDFESPEK